MLAQQRKKPPMQSSNARLYVSLHEGYRALESALVEMRAIRDELAATDDLRSRVALEAKYTAAFKSWRNAFDNFGIIVRSIGVPRSPGNGEGTAPKRGRAATKKASPRRRPMR